MCEYILCVTYLKIVKQYTSKIFIIVIAAIALITLPNNYSFSGTIDELVERVEEVYRSTEDITANFEQISMIKSLNMSQNFNGVVCFKKGGRILWDYNPPHAQKIVSNGAKFWFYSPEDKEVLVINYDEAFKSRTPIVFLAGVGQLREHFHVTLLHDDEITHEKLPQKDHHIFQLIPRGEDLNLKKMLLYISKESFLIKGTMTVDAFNTSNTIFFSKIKRNSGLPDNIFEFTPPEEVRIITPLGGGIQK